MRVVPLPAVLLVVCIATAGITGVQATPGPATIQVASLAVVDEVPDVLEYAFAMQLNVDSDTYDSVTLRVPVAVSDAIAGSSKTASFEVRAFESSPDDQDPATQVLLASASTSHSYSVSSGLILSTYTWNDVLQVNIPIASFVNSIEALVSVSFASSSSPTVTQGTGIVAGPSVSTSGNAVSVSFVGLCKKGMAAVADAQDMAFGPFHYQALSFQWNAQVAAHPCEVVKSAMKLLDCLVAGSAPSTLSSQGSLSGGPMQNGISAWSVGALVTLGGGCITQPAPMVPAYADLGSSSAPWDMAVVGNTITCTPDGNLVTPNGWEFEYTITASVGDATYGGWTPAGKTEITFDMVDASNSWTDSGYFSNPAGRAQCEAVLKASLGTSTAAAFTWMAAQTLNVVVPCIGTISLVPMSNGGYLLSTGNMNGLCEFSADPYTRSWSFDGQFTLSGSPPVVNVVVAVHGESLFTNPGAVVAQGLDVANHLV